MVVLVLLDGCKAADGVVYVHVYRTLSAPWRTVYYRCAVVVDAYHRVVVVDECAAGYVFYPQVAVCAFALAAGTQEHISFAVVLNDSRVHQQCLVVRSAKCEYDHQGIVEAEPGVGFVASCGYDELLLLVIALHESAWNAALVYCEYLVGSAVLTVYLEFCRWARERANLLAVPRRYQAVVVDNLEQQVVGLLFLERCKVGQYCQYIPGEGGYCKIVSCYCKISFLHICCFCLCRAVALLQLLCIEYKSRKNVLNIQLNNNMFGMCVRIFFSLEVCGCCGCNGACRFRKQ